MDAIETAAARLHEAARSGTPCAPVRDLLPPGDIAAAYAVQARNTARALGAGRRLVGRKIGLTARAVQRQLGVDQPDYGSLFADMAALIAGAIEANGRVEAVVSPTGSPDGAAHYDVMVVGAGFAGAEGQGGVEADNTIDPPKFDLAESTDYDECLACQ